MPDRIGGMIELCAAAAATLARAIARGVHAAGPAAGDRLPTWRERYGIQAHRGCRLNGTRPRRPDDIRASCASCSATRRLSVAEVAREAGMSQTPAWRRIKRLKEGGAIRAVVALVDRRAAGLDFVAYAFVKLGLPSRQNMENFDRLVKLWPEVLVCERVTGAVDYLIKVVTEDIERLRSLPALQAARQRASSPTCSRASSSSTVKDTPALPIEPALGSRHPGHAASSDCARPLGLDMAASYGGAIEAGACSCERASSPPALRRRLALLSPGALAASSGAGVAQLGARRCSRRRPWTAPDLAACLSILPVRC